MSESKNKPTPCFAIASNEFIRWTYAKALSHRQPRYEKMSNWGITVKAEDIEKVKNSNQFNLLIESALANK